MDWIDILLLTSEADLQHRLRELTPAERAALRTYAIATLKLSEEDVEAAVLRILIERLRPFALPQDLWSRPVNDTSSIRRHAGEHLKHLGFDVSEDRLAAMQKLYRRSQAERVKLGVTRDDLMSCNWRCQHCGLIFHNEELESLALESPFGARPRSKEDRLKPHWNKLDLRRPRLDHVWPISTFGSNDADNLQVLCDGCNQGKEDLLAHEQTRGFVGLQKGRHLKRVEPISLDLFYAQVARSGRCVVTGKVATETELTIRLRDKRLPAVLDNLETVESPEPQL